MAEYVRVVHSVRTRQWGGVQLGLQVGYALRSFLFAVLMDMLTDEVRQEALWIIIFADE